MLGRMRSAVRYPLVGMLLAAGSGGGCAALNHCGFGGCPGDAKTTADVQALFEQHPALGPPNLLSIQTLDRVVYLYGLVDTDLERQLAESVAHEVPGVENVVNSIGISGNR
jgi:osmotically-inducible protein OsmY